MSDLARFANRAKVEHIDSNHSTSILGGATIAGFDVRVVPPVMTRSATAFFVQSDIRDRHGTVDCFAHVVNRERCHRNGGQRLHLHTRTCHRGHRRRNREPVRALRLERDGDASIPSG